MTGYDVVFVLVGLVTAGASILTVTSKNLVHAALHLAVTLAGIAGVFLVLHADFLALVQLIVYVGAVTVLFLFGLMLTRAPIGREALDSQNRGLGIAVAGGLFVTLSALIVMAYGGEAGVVPERVATTDIGVVIFSTWVLPFEVLSMLLLAALIGAIVLARREAGDSGEALDQAIIDFGDAPTGEQGLPETRGGLGGDPEQVELAGEHGPGPGGVAGGIR